MIRFTSGDRKVAGDHRVVVSVFDLHANDRVVIAAERDGRHDPAVANSCREGIGNSSGSRCERVAIVDEVGCNPGIRAGFETRHGSLPTEVTSCEKRVRIHRNESRLSTDRT